MIWSRLHSWNITELKLKHKTPDSIFQVGKRERARPGSLASQPFPRAFWVQLQVKAVQSYVCSPRDLRKLEWPFPTGSIFCKTG